MRRVTMPEVASFRCPGWQAGRADALPYGARTTMSTGGANAIFCGL